MSRRSEYGARLRDLPPQRWAEHLRAHSGLPGPRANLELAEACADEGDAAQFEALLDTDDEYLVLCGTIGFGRLLAERADPRVVRRLRALAADGRWRVREGVAMALQRLGDADPVRLRRLATAWAGDADPLVQRAAVCGVCEPRLLTPSGAGAYAVRLCDRVTGSLAARPAGERRSAGARALRKALGYCWSVAVAADPVAGLGPFRALAGSGDPDVAWIARENAKKARIAALL